MYSVQNNRQNTLYKKQRGSNLESPEVNRRIRDDARKYAENYMLSKYGRQTVSSIQRREKASIALGASALMAVPALVVGGVVYKSLR